MNKANFSKLINNFKTSVSKHSPEILTGIGIAGMITTTVLAVKATPKALYLIEDRKDELETNKLSVLETVKTVWKPYIPAVVSGTFSIACIVGASSVNAKRNAALATAYKLSEEAFTVYKQKVVETIGEKKENAVREKVDQERIDKNPVSDNQVFITEKGNTLFYDGVSGRYFKSDIESIKKAINVVNREMNYSNYVSLSEFYDEIGLAHTNVSDYLGWNLDDGLIDIHFGTRIADNDEPCIVLDYHIVPRYDFDKLM